MGRGVCSICRETGIVGQDVYKCKMGSCGHYLHYKCLKAIDAAGQYLKIHRYVHQVSAMESSHAFTVHIWVHTCILGIHLN